MASFASAENHVFELFISKCCHFEHNEDNHLKPTPSATYFPKFLWEVKSLLISLAAFELLKFEKWPHVVLWNYSFGKESILQFFRTLRCNSVDFFAANSGLNRGQREGRIYEQWTPPQPNDSLAPMRNMHNKSLDNQTPPLLKPSIVPSSSNQSSQMQSNNELPDKTSRLSIQEELSQPR